MSGNELPDDPFGAGAVFSSSGLYSTPKEKSDSIGGRYKSEGGRVPADLQSIKSTLVRELIDFPTYLIFGSLSSEKDAIVTAMANFDVLLDKTHQYLSNSGYQHRAQLLQLLDLYFPGNSEEEVRIAYGSLLKRDSVSKPMLFHVGNEAASPDGDRTYAYVLPSGIGSMLGDLDGLLDCIYLCPTFFDKTPLEQGATILHELTHLILDTSDHQYGQEDCIIWAKDHSAKALDNADSLAYFAKRLVLIETAPDVQIAWIEDKIQKHRS